MIGGGPPGAVADVTTSYTADAAGLGVAVVRGLPDPARWPAPLVFALDVPLLDCGTELLRPIDQRSHRPQLVIVPRGAEAAAGLRALLASPGAADALAQLRSLPGSLLLLEVERERWYAPLRFKSEHDCLLLTAADDHGRWALRVHQYVLVHDSIAFDDAYRRTVLRGTSLAQTVDHFLRVLERQLPHTRASTGEKRLLFAACFPFYDGEHAPAREVGLADPQHALTPLRTAILDGALASFPEEYALALSALSEVGACLTHVGLGARHLELMEGLVTPGLERTGVLGGDAVRRLRDTQPVLYLHLRYRVPNQWTIARFDQDGSALRDPGVTAALGRLLDQLEIEEADLHWVKRRWELAALSGSTALLQTFRGRYARDQPLLREARRRAETAIAAAPPTSRAQDVNYWILAALSEITLFGWGALTPAEHETLLAHLDAQLREAPDDPFNVMVATAAAAVEAAQVAAGGPLGKRADERSITPASIAGALESARGNRGDYALALAAGYAALRWADGRWDADLDRALERAGSFFARWAETSTILDVVGLKLAALRIFHLARTGRLDEARVAAAQALATVERLRGFLGPDAPVEPYFRAVHDDRSVPSAAGALEASFCLPY